MWTSNVGSTFNVGINKNIPRYVFDEMFVEGPDVHTFQGSNVPDIYIGNHPIIGRIFKLEWIN